VCFSICRPQDPPAQRGRGRGRVRGAGRARGRPRVRGNGPENQEEPPPPQWKDPDEVEDVAPDQPRFTPRQEPGVLLPAMQNFLPIDLFRLFFTHRVVDDLTKNTNKHMERNPKAYKWSPVSRQKFYAWLGVLIFMGLVRLPSVQDYWEQDFFGQRFAQSTMSRHDFLSIMWSLHISDPNEDDRQAALKRTEGQVGYNPLHKLCPLYPQIQEACQTYYQPRQHISIDERMVASKARIAFKQYIKDKPTKWGYKLWVLADSQTGYTYRFEIYAGKRNTPSDKGLSYDVVNNLMAPLLNQGYCLYTDNFYSSPTLFSYLFQNRTPAVGTVRENRKGFPKNGLGGLSKHDIRGTTKWIRKDELLFVKWRDTRDVSVLSTMHSGNDQVMVTRNTKDHNHNLRVLNILRPKCIADYNQHMGGVDLSDQLIVYYNVLMKTKKWYKTLLFHFVDVAIVNAYLLYKDMCVNTGVDPMSQKYFRRDLAQSLKQEWIDAEAIRAVGHNPDIHPTKCCPTAIIDPDSVPGNLKATAGRKNCFRCYRDEKKEMRTPWKCSVCSVPLCLQLDRNCFAMFHNIAV
jgi:hypothetical protein